MRLFILLLLLISYASFLVAQEGLFVPQNILVQLKTTTELKSTITFLKKHFPETSWNQPKQLVPGQALYKLVYNGAVAEAAIVEKLYSHSAVIDAQFNHYVTMRKTMLTTPNDTEFSKQWHHVNTGGSGGIVDVDMDSDQAWDISTGGLTKQNDTIVVAVIDNGVELTHPDITPNRWINHAEIPNNNVDDDNNGYVDDYLGWNPLSQNDNISGGSHGTPVAGIVGASGNNSRGVVGVNWKVKMMIINSGNSTNEADVLSAYGYALTQRKLYNQTNGQKGAFVVATNASWGIDGGDPADAPLWCAFYDTLGAHGLLNVGATANQNSNVDVVGDLPTTCPSDYLVGVTNINKRGQKITGAGYGTTHIDIGAFGEGVYTTRNGNAYNTFGGTSGATPQVTGAIALIYAAACENFIVYSKIQPDSAALKIKEHLLSGVTQTAILGTQTASGGYLNLYRSLLLNINDCPTSTCFAPYSINLTSLLETEFSLTWNTTSTVQSTEVRYREIGGNWTTPVSATTNYTFTGLKPCTEYEVELTSICNNTAAYSAIKIVKTDGCCDPPANLQSGYRTTDSISIRWDSVRAVQSYLVQYKDTSTQSTWSAPVNIIGTNFTLGGLSECAFYDFRIRGLCKNGDTTAFTPVLRVNTTGCISCANLPYCASAGASSLDDWIAALQIDNKAITTNNNGGYFFQDTIRFLLRKGGVHTFSITKGLLQYNEYFRVWIDSNNDGDFNEANELVCSDTMSLKTKQTTFTVPATALLGVTRMRVALRWGQHAPDCGAYDFGEVEDYCIEIIKDTLNANRLIENSQNTFKVQPNPFKSTLWVELKENKSEQIRCRLYNLQGQLVFDKNKRARLGQDKIQLNVVVPPGVYFLELSSQAGRFVQKVIKQ